MQVTPALRAMLLLGLIAPAVAQPSAERADGPRAATGAAKMTNARAPYPLEIRRALAWGRQECRAQGGGSATYGPGIVRTADLTGDGRPDFVVDYREARCPGYLGMFNGTGGWDLEILVTRARGRVVSVFAGRVRDYDLSEGAGPRTMTFSLHGSYCGKGGADTCVKRRTMDGRRFDYRDR